jgi:hypothetical protein
MIFQSTRYLQVINVMSNNIIAFPSQDLSEADMDLFIAELEELDNIITTNTIRKNEHAVIFPYHFMESILLECKLSHALHGDIILPSDCITLLPVTFKLYNSTNDYNKQHLQTLLIALQNCVKSKIGLYWWWDIHE